MKLERYFSPAQIAGMLGLSTRTVREWAKPVDGRPGVFGAGVLFLSFPKKDGPPKAPSGAGRGGSLPPPREGEYRIPLSGYEAFVARRRVFLGHPDVKGGT